MSDKNEPAMSQKGTLWKCVGCEKVSPKHIMRERIEVYVTVCACISSGLLKTTNEPEQFEVSHGEKLQS